LFSRPAPILTIVSARSVIWLVHVYVNLDLLAFSAPLYVLLGVYGPSRRRRTIVLEALDTAIPKSGGEITQCHGLLERSEICNCQSPKFAQMQLDSLNVDCTCH